MIGEFNGRYKGIIVYGIEVYGSIAGNSYEQSPYTFIPIFPYTPHRYVEL
jgi:hypothetical protein